MLYVSEKNGDSFDWYVGDGRVWRRFPQDAANVDFVQADGDELTYILDNFNNLPHYSGPNKRVHRWFGDHARLIVGNL